jgi:hypothetical protein
MTPKAADRRKVLRVRFSIPVVFVFLLVMNSSHCQDPTTPRPVAMSLPGEGASTSNASASLEEDLPLPGEVSTPVSQDDHSPAAAGPQGEDHAAVYPPTLPPTPPPPPSPGLVNCSSGDATTIPGTVNCSVDDATKHETEVSNATAVELPPVMVFPAPPIGTTSNSTPFSFDRDKFFTRATLPPFYFTFSYNYDFRTPYMWNKATTSAEVYMKAFKMPVCDMDNSLSLGETKYVYKT